MSTEPEPAQFILIDFAHYRKTGETLAIFKNADGGPTLAMEAEEFHKWREDPGVVILDPAVRSWIVRSNPEIDPPRYFGTEDEAVAYADQRRDESDAIGGPLYWVEIRARENNLRF